MIYNILAIGRRTGRPECVDSCNCLQDEADGEHEERPIGEVDEPLHLLVFRSQGAGENYPDQEVGGCQDAVQHVHDAREPPLKPAATHNHDTISPPKWKRDHLLLYMYYINYKASILESL